MNILILNWKDIKNPTAGGAEIVTYEHARRWIKAGHTVTWLSSAFRKSLKEETIEGIKIRRFGNIYQVYLFAPYFYLFGGQKFDLVIDEVHGIPFFTPFYVRKPKLILIHEIAGEIWDYMYSFPFNYLGKVLERFYLTIYRNQYFWTDCKSTIDELVKNGIKRKRCIAIPCPSNAKPISKPIINKQLIFVSVSRIVKMKGIEDVIKAFSIVNKKFLNSKLLIIGDGDKRYINYLKKELVRANGIEKNVQFLGYVEEKKKLNILKKSYLLLHASVKEGWGIVVIEAASQSTPAVVYNVPGLSESVKNKLTGVVLSKNSFEEMANSVIRLTQQKNTYRKYQKNCLEWANDLNWDDQVKKSLSMLNKLKS